MASMPLWISFKDKIRGERNREETQKRQREETEKRQTRDRKETEERQRERKENGRGVQPRARQRSSGSLPVNGSSGSVWRLLDRSRADTKSWVLVCGIAGQATVGKDCFATGFCLQTEDRKWAEAVVRTLNFVGK